MYYPSAGVTLSACPIVIWLHPFNGNADKSAAGNNNSVVQWREYARRGIVCYTLNFTLAVEATPSTNHPKQLNDIKCFLSYLAEGLGYGDPQKITLTGHSGGAYLALMAGLTSKSTFTGGGGEDHTSTAYTIVGMVVNAPPTDLNAWYADPSSGPSQLQACEDILGYAPPTNPSGATLASPINYVSSSPTWTLLQVGSADTLVVPATNSGAMYTAFLAAGATTVVYTIYPGLPHSSAPWFTTTDQPFLDRLGFIEGHGR